MERGIRAENQGAAKVGWEPVDPVVADPVRQDNDRSQENRRRTNVQQQTCNIDLSCSFIIFLFSFVVFELKPFVLKGKVLGEIFRKSVRKCGKF